MSNPNTSRPQEPERRFLPTASTAVSGRTVSGYAALFGVRSQNLGSASAAWHEVIAQGAFPSLASQDCRALVNHEPSQILARSKNGTGTLKLSIDSKGLKFEFQAPKTQAGEDLLESIRRKDVDQCSFGFVVAPNGDKWEKSGAVQVRTITKISSLLDISIVTYPAYQETSVSARSKTSGKPVHPTVAAWQRRLNLLK